MKEKLWRYFTYTNNRRYVDVMPALVESYNNTIHSFNLPPIHSTFSEFSQLLKSRGGLAHALCRSRVKKIEIENRRPSQTVHSNSILQGYLPGWTDKLFQVAQVFRDNPPYYKIEGLQGEWLEGTFYEEELQKIYKKDDVFRIEHILQQRKRKKELNFW